MTVDAFIVELCLIRMVTNTFEVYSLGASYSGKVVYSVGTLSCSSMTVIFYFASAVDIGGGS